MPVAVPSRPKTLQHKGSGWNVSTTAAPAKAPTASAPSQRSNLTVDTNVAPPVLDNLSPGVRDVAEHAAQLKALLHHVGAIYDMVGRQATHMTKISPAVLGQDQLATIRKDMTTSKDVQDKKLEDLRNKIETDKQLFLKQVNGRISTMIKEFVAKEVRRRVQDQVQRQLESMTKRVEQNRDEIIRRQTIFNNIEARHGNSLIRSKWPREPLHRVARPLPAASPVPPPKSSPVPTVISISCSSQFPGNLQELLTLGPAVATALIKEYGLDDSSKKLGEDKHLENINRLMTHFGIGYRLLPAIVNKPILTSVWDR